VQYGNFTNLINANRNGFNFGFRGVGQAFYDFTAPNESQPSVRLVTPGTTGGLRILGNAVPDLFSSNTVLWLSNSGKTGAVWISSEKTGFNVSAPPEETVDVVGNVRLSGLIRSTGVTFANLGTPANGATIYCSDCTKANPCASGGNGAFAERINGAWDCGGSGGTVTSMSVVTANGVSGSVANATTTPAITLSLGAITPTSVAASGTVSAFGGTIRNTTTATGVTELIVRAGEGQGTTNLMRFRTSADGELANINSSGGVLTNNSFQIWTGGLEVGTQNILMNATDGIGIASDRFLAWSATSQAFAAKDVSMSRFGSGTIQAGTGGINGAGVFRAARFLLTALTTPASSTAACVQGSQVWDADFIYICTSTNNWKRATLNTF
jgi:hypothetical protein